MYILLEIWRTWILALDRSRLLRCFTASQKALLIFFVLMERLLHKYIYLNAIQPAGEKIKLSKRGNREFGNRGNNGFFIRRFIGQKWTNCWRFSCRWSCAIFKLWRKKLLKEKNVEQRLYELEDIGEPDPWPSTIDSWWSYLLTAVDAEWMKFGNKLSDVKEPALEASAPVSDVNSVFR